MSLIRGLLIVPPAAAGVAILAYTISNREAPVRELPAETATSARVLTVAPQTFIPRIVGFGSAEPSQTWSAVAQVAGRVDYVSPAFVRGGLVRKGDILIRIADDEYELAIAQSRANIESAEAQIEEMQLSRETTKLSLEIEQSALDLAEKDLERQEKLVDRGTISVSAVDAQREAVLVQRAKLQVQSNKLALFPAQLKALTQARAVAEAELKIAELNLDRTRILAPFDGRISEAEAEISQFISVGTRMGALDGIKAAEIDVQIPPNQMTGFVRIAFSGREPPRNPSEFTRGIKLLSAVVGIGFAGTGPIWKADVKRISDVVDPQTRSLGVIVSVAEPYRNLRAGSKPPLIKGMFTKVELRGPAVDAVVLLPRTAVRDGRVKVVDAESRLRLVPVEVDFVFQDAAVIRTGLAEGTKVIVSDLSPAIEGMLLNPVEDDEVFARMEHLAKPRDRLTMGVEEQ